MKHSGLNDKLFDMIAIIISGLLLIITLYPLIYVLSASFSDPVIVTKGELWLLPKGLTLDGYKQYLIISRFGWDTAILFFTLYSELL